jgi:tetratricopeptide (TPR) repeat protein
MENRAFHELIRLDALDDRMTTELFDARLRDVALPDRARTRILEAAGGNPLFLEQILTRLVDDGYLEQSPTGWSVARDMSTLSVPPTIAALLAARLERLSPPERATIERASVVGKVFWWGSVAELSPSEDRPAVGGHLTTLVSRELIRPDPVGPDATVFPGDEAFRFRHLLVRDAAYTRLPKASRAELHERFATWLEAHAGGASDYSAIVGYHLEQAVLHMRELAIDPESSDRLALRAASLLGAAGMAAHERGETAAAVNLLTRAVDLWPHAATERREHLYSLATSLWLAGRPDEGEARLDELSRALAAAPDPRWELRVRLRRADRAHVRGGEGSVAALETVAREALAAYEVLDDPRLGAQAWESLGALWIQQGKVRAEDDALALALPLAIAAGDRRRITTLMMKLANRSRAGERPIPAGIALCQEILDDPATGLELRADALCSLGLLIGLDDRVEDARTTFGDARRIIDELGLVITLVNDLPWEAAIVERWSGDLDVAERYLREAIAMQREMRDHWHLSGTSAGLAELITLQHGRLDRARRKEVRDLLDEDRRVTLPEDIVSSAQSRSTLARLLSFEGQHDEALALSTEACALIDQTEELLFRFEIRNTLHDVAEAAGRDGLAREAATVALELARLKQCRLFERIALGYLAEA